MEYLKITRANNVRLYKRGHFWTGDLHLTTHHLIFTHKLSNGVMKEIWISYPIIDQVELKAGSCLLDIIHLLNYNDHLIPKKHYDTLESFGYDKNVVKEVGPLSAGSGASKGSVNSNGISESNITSDPMAAQPQRNRQQSSSLNLIDNLKDISKLYQGSSMKIRCKDFLNVSIDFHDIKTSKDVFESIKKLTVLSDISQLYAFLYNPIPIEQKFNSWNIYDIEEEFTRQGLFLDPSKTVSPQDSNNNVVGSRYNWRISKINHNYQFCDTYSKSLIVPKSISDNVLKYAGKFRSKNRVPCLTYYYKKNGCTITRSSQPLAGLTQSRSIQDEKLIDEIFKSNNGNNVNLIVDARPLTNALAQTALGGGTEIMDNYKFNKKKFLGIDNIHIMRDSLNKIFEILNNSDLLMKLPTLNSTNLQKTNWLKFIKLIFDGVDLMIKSLYFNNCHLMIHCSDGWDRTSQVCSLVQICLDPFYRTLKGFIILIEKDWSSFGHRFNERSNHLSAESRFINELSNDEKSLNKLTNLLKKRNHVKFSSPIFQQFLDCVYQLVVQFLDKFEFNERFLRRLIYHLYSCQYGNFLVNNEYEKQKYDLTTKTRSVWDYFLSRSSEFINGDYRSPEQHQTEKNNDKDDVDILFVNIESVKWWYQLYGRTDDEMNSLSLVPQESLFAPSEIGKKVAMTVDGIQKKFEISGSEASPMNETGTNIEQDNSVNGNSTKSFLDIGLEKLNFSI